MSGPDYPDAFDGDAQDSAEAFDETLLDSREENNEMRTLEEMEVPDLLQLDGDRDDDEALALDADEFDEDAIGDEDTEEDDELDYHAATEEHEDDLDGLGPQDDVGEIRTFTSDIDGVDEVRDADEAEGGEDDFTDFSSKGLADEDLKSMGYSEERGGETRAKPDR